MEKFKVVVTRTDEFEIQIDPAVWDTESLESWSQVFHDVQTREDVAKTLAERISLNFNATFFEGFGYVRFQNAEGKDRYQLPLDSFCKGIVVKVISEEELETEVDKIQ